MSSYESGYDFTVGEERHSSAGNIYRFLGWVNPQKVRIERVGVMRRGHREPPPDWEVGTSYLWLPSQWDSLPLVGHVSHDPSFGIFLPRGVFL